MTNPTKYEAPVSFVKSCGENGAVREFWVKCGEIIGAADCDAESVLCYTESPFPYNVYIVQALLAVTTLDAQDADLDIGISDDSSATNADDSLFDSVINTAVGVYAGMLPVALNAPARILWKAAGSAADSFITVQQNGDVDAAALRANVFVKVIPAADLGL